MLLTSYNDHMKTVSITDFKAHCLKLIEHVRQTGECLTITKRGKPAARVIPPEEPERRTYRLGLFEKDLISMGDVVSPLDIEWEAMK